jgi:protein TonB
MGLLFPDYGISFGKPRGSNIAFMGAAAGHALLLGMIARFVPAERNAELTRPVTARVIELAPDMPRPLPPRRPAPRKLSSAPLPVLATDRSAPASEAAPFTVAAQVPATPASPPMAVASMVPPAPTFSAARFDPDYLSNPKPLYPPASRRLREEGQVVLRVRVSPAGLAEGIELRHSSGFPRLDQAALEAVARWRFIPARRGAEAVSAWVLVPINFNLQG